MWALQPPWKKTFATWSIQSRYLSWTGTSSKMDWPTLVFQFPLSDFLLQSQQWEALGGAVFYSSYSLFHLHHCPVAVAQLEDVQVILGINVLLHSAVLARNSNNTMVQILFCAKNSVWKEKTWRGPSTRSLPPPSPSPDHRGRDQLSTHTGRQAARPEIEPFYFRNDLPTEKRKPRSTARWKQKDFLHTRGLFRECSESPLK